MRLGQLWQLRIEMDWDLDPWWSMVGGSLGAPKSGSLRVPVSVTWRRCSNISGMSSKLLQEDVTTYQEHLASDVTKIFERIRNILQITERSCYTVSGTSCMLLKEVVPTYQECLQSYFKKMLQRIRNILQVTSRRFSNVSGTSCKVLGEDVTPYQERLASYLKKLFRCIGNVCKWRHQDYRMYQEHLAS